VEENVKEEEESQWQIFVTKTYDIVGGQRRRFERIIRHCIS
jgi:hypothetical protein